MHDYVQRSFTSTVCPGTHTGFYYASIRLLSLRHTFSAGFFDTGSAISWRSTTIVQHYPRRKRGKGGRKEHKVEMR